jgi:ABC-type uncharacterized transport system substrate-binding protein
MKKQIALAFTIGVCLGWIPAAQAQDVLVVLSSDALPYNEALAGFREAYGSTVSSVQLSKQKFVAPPPHSLVVAFGTKAAVDVSSSFEGPMIYGVTPGFKLPVDPESRTLIHVHTSPSVPLVVQRYKEIQPSLHRLAVIWIGESIADLFDKKGEVKTSFGVDLLSVRLRRLEDLPDQLRNLEGKVDAIWMPPDAALITPQNFAVVREFCLAQHLAFYVPSDGLVDKGATAAVYTSFRDLGRLAGVIARQSADGNLGESRSVFPDKTSMAINVAAANRIGLKITPATLQKADKIVP